MSNRLILASASPRRRELLALLGVPFEVHTSRVEEDWSTGQDPREFAVLLAREKALDVWRREVSSGRRFVLGADTVVVVDTERGPEPLNKPEGRDNAERMLRLLSGITHTVYTGLALVTSSPALPDPVITDAVVGTEVTFRALTDDMIRAYLLTGEPYDKAGAYGIQGHASPFVERIEGDYFNVVGLPVHTVGWMLEAAGVEWWRGQDALG
jgi:septum formation protein